MLLTLEKYKLFESRIPEDVELNPDINYPGLTLSDIDIIDLGGNGIDTAFLGVKIKGEDGKYNPGIVLDLKQIGNLYKLDILLAPELQGKGLGKLLMTKLVYEFGHFVSENETRVNDVQLPKIYNYLSHNPDFTVLSNDFGKLVILNTLENKEKIIQEFEQLGNM
jgi:GNAT superfamily N-acetyltransferase